MQIRTKISPKWQVSYPLNSKDFFSFLIFLKSLIVQVKHSRSPKDSILKYIFGVHKSSGKSLERMIFQFSRKSDQKFI